MRVPEERQTVSAVGQPGKIAQAIVFSVLISIGVLLFTLWWGRLEVIITLLLALLSAFASGATLMRMLAAEKQRTLAVLWRSLVFSAVGFLLLVLAGHNDWLTMLPGVVIGGIGLGSASQTIAAMLQPLASISVGAGVVLLVSSGATLSAALLIQSHASSNFAIALLIDLILLGALVVRIAECDAA